MTTRQIDSGAGQSRLPSLTGMRFIAALLVFLTHASVAKAFTDQGIDSFMGTYLSRAGFLGVGFFFVLSGFVLTWSARPADRTGRFYRRRFFKVYPNHLVTWFVGLLLMIKVGADLTATATVPSLLLVQSWVPNLTALGGTNGPSWSLACEALFYLSFPLLLRLVKRIRAERLWLWVALLTVGFFAVPLVSQLLPGTPLSPWQPVSMLRYWFVYFLPATRLLDFALGILMGRIVQTGRWIGLSWPTALLLLAGGYALMVYLPDSYGLVAPTALPVALLIAAAAVQDVKGERTPFAGRRMRWLGEISFAFYMVHFLVFQYGPLGLAATTSAGARSWHTPTALGMLAITLLLSVAFGWLLYRLVEQPAMRRFGHPARRPAAAAPTGSTPVAVPTPAAD